MKACFDNLPVIIFDDFTEALGHSILKKAFSGKLVPQDPNDEAVSVLVERVKGEKANLNCQVKMAKAGKKPGLNTKTQVKK